MQNFLIVDSPLSRRLVYDVLVVVISQSSRELLVVHLGLVLALAPFTSDLTRELKELKGQIIF